MKQVDFLPSAYRQRHTPPPGQSWRVVVIGVVASVICVAALLQYAATVRLRGELDKVQPAYEAARVRQQQLSDMQKDLAKARATADLYAYLRHPWPRTQLLVPLLKALPDGVQFEQLQIVRDNTQPPADMRAVQDRPTVGPQGESVAKKLPAAQRDLQRLRDECNRTRTLIRIMGSTSDGAAPHAYLAELAKCDLYAKAELESLDTAESKEGLISRFRICLIVKPGYGQPGGPALKPEIASASRKPTATVEKQN